MADHRHISVMSGDWLEDGVGTESSETWWWNHLQLELVLRRHPFGQKYLLMADNNEYGLRNGWLIGEHKPMQKPLNQRTYDPLAAGTEGLVAIAEAFIADLCNGRNTAWLGEILSKLPMFVDVKS